ncbi:hypothetical protein [Nonomuraea sp. NPDC050783]|uniref:hypothetical protein n=1 Tax=Nonomuraea sp. NPDC050783 TaxID=3154634 RepID=UPI0034674176
MAPPCRSSSTATGSSPSTANAAISDGVSGHGGAGTVMISTTRSYARHHARGGSSRSATS